MSGCDCAHARTNLEELIRGELTAADCGPIRAHLAECGDCRDEQEVFEKLTIAVQRACSEAAPPTLRDAILSGLNELQTTRSSEAASFCACGERCRCNPATPS